MRTILLIPFLLIYSVLSYSQTPGSTRGLDPHWRTVPTSGTGTTPPSTCVALRDVYVSSTGVVSYCISSNTWASIPVSVNSSGQGYLLPFGAGYPLASTVTVANEVRYYQFVLSFHFSLTKVVFNISTPQPASNIRVGIYKSPCSTANTLISQSSNSASTAAGGLLVTFASPVVLAPGIYWFALTSDTSGIAYHTNYSVIAVPGLLMDANPRLATGRHTIPAFQLRRLGGIVRLSAVHYDGTLKYAGLDFSGNMKADFF
jgi:hypothetical protein